MNSLDFNFVFDSMLMLLSGTLSPDEWEVAYLYLAFVLRKVSIEYLFWKMIYILEILSWAWFCRGRLKTIVKNEPENWPICLLHCFREANQTRHRPTQNEREGKCIYRKRTSRSSVANLWNSQYFINDLFSKSGRITRTLWHIASTPRLKGEWTTQPVGSFTVGHKKIDVTIQFCRFTILKWCFCSFTPNNNLL